MTDLTKLVQRPGLGRATDKRVTAEYLQARRLSGTPFDAERDVDLVDELNGALGTVAALVAYADPELHTEIVETLEKQRVALAQSIDATSRADARIAALGVTGLFYLPAEDTATSYALQVIGPGAVLNPDTLTTVTVMGQTFDLPTYDISIGVGT
jgi:hypothetical protein